MARRSNSSNSQAKPHKAATGTGATQNAGAKSDDAVRSRHPCFSKKAHFIVGRMHLPVAPKCNLGCNFCDRKVSDCYHSFRPGVSSKILTPKEALELVTAKAVDPIKVVGIAGPGEPLYNPETFETLRLVRDARPDLTLCLSTNGLLLEEKAEELKELGVRTITITMNAITPETAARIYGFAIVGGKRTTGLAAAKAIVEAQEEGLERAVEAGLIVKVNTVYIPGINDTEVEAIAHIASEHGAVLHNIIPLIPLAKMADLAAPSCEQLSTMRRRCGEIIEEFYHCKQCRADAVGVPGTERC